MLKTITFSLLALFALLLLAPASADARVEAGSACKLFPVAPDTDACEIGLLCLETATSASGEGVCRTPGSAESAFGLGTESQFRDVGIGQDRDLKSSIANIINIVLGFLGIVAVIIILAGGFKWMTAAGNEDKVGEARQMIIQGVIGLLVVFAAWAIASFVVSNLQSATT